MQSLAVLLGTTPGAFIGLTVVLIGGAAILAGRAIGNNWKPAWQAVAACFGLALFDRFLTYALFQIPIGSLADKFGPRIVLTASIVAWSVVTALTGLAWSFGSLLVLRLLLGVCESGAFPSAAALVNAASAASYRPAS